MTNPPPSSPSKLPPHYYDDLTTTRDNSTKAHSNLRSSCIGFSSPSPNSNLENNLNSDEVARKRYKGNIPKFNLEQDSLVKKTEETFKSLCDEETQDIHFFKDMDPNKIAKFNINSIGSLEEISEADELKDNRHIQMTTEQDNNSSVNFSDNQTVNNSNKVVSNKGSPQNNNMKVRQIDLIR